MPHKDPVVRRQYIRDYKRKNRERMLIDKADSDRVKNANRRARLYKVPGRITIDDVRRVMAARRCHYCGESDGDRGNRSRWLTIDHRVPMSGGGPNVFDNLVACCFSCNASKFRGETPGRWSRTRDECARCGKTDRPHTSKGYCSACYQALFGHRAKRKAVHGHGASVRPPDGVGGVPPV